MIEGVLKKWTNPVHVLNSNATDRDRAYSELLSEITSWSAVRQGCLRSPFLFNFATIMLSEETVLSSKFSEVDIITEDPPVDLE